MEFNSQQQQAILISKERALNCSTSFLSSYYETPDLVQIKIHPLLCNSPYCETCNNIKRIKLYNKLLQFSKNRQLRFLTLTYKYDDNYKNILDKYSKDFNKFITYIRRLNYKFNYFKIIEFTKNKIIHFHLLIDSYVPQQLLSNLWFQITSDSFIVFITRLLNNKQLINYCLKYITKSFNNNQDLFTAFKIRRFSFSRFTFDFNKCIELVVNKFKMVIEIYQSKESLINNWKSIYKFLYDTKVISHIPKLEFL